MDNKETLEEAAFRLYPRLINDPYNPMEDDNKESREDFIAGAKWQAKQMYSEEDMKKCWEASSAYTVGSHQDFKQTHPDFRSFIEKFKKQNK